MSAIINSSKNGDVRLNCADKATVIAQVVDIIGVIYSMRGQVYPDGDREIAAKLVLTLLDDEFKSLTLNEFIFAMTKGVIGNYGEYFGLSPVTYIHWVRKYWASDDKRKRVLRKHQQTDVSKMLRSENKPDLEKALISAAYRSFDEFKKAGSCSDRGNVVYDFLDEKGLIQFTKAEKLRFMDLAGKELAAQRSAAANDMVRLQIGRLLDEMHERGTGGANMRKIIAKRLALNEFFKRLMKNKSELNLTIKTK